MDTSSLSPAAIATETDMQSKLNPDFVQCLFALKAQVELAPHGGKRSLVEGFAKQYAKSPQVVYEYLRRECGFDAGRKRRADSGKSRINNDTLDFIASAKRESIRGNKKAIMPTCVAMNIADANGLEVNMSETSINRLLRERGLSHATLAEPRDHIRLRSLHPNHVHQIDPSVCVIYYMNGRQHIMDERDFNKNKPQNYVKIKLKVWRYVRYDHASGALDVRYYEAAGEDQHSMFEFLQWTWGQQKNRLAHGVPKRLIWDKGSANTSKAIQGLLDALGVMHETHATGHAWVKGGVEVTNNIVETHFESRLKLEPVETIEQLNNAVERWVRDYNANAIKFVDSRVIRDDGVPRSRDDLWHTIAAGELIAMPADNICRFFFHGAAQSRKIVNQQISFKHPELARPAIYKLDNWAQHFGKGERVQLLPLLGKGGAVRIQIERLAQAPLLIEVEPMTQFDDFGRDASAQVLGEGYSRAADSATMLSSKRLNELTYGARDIDEADKLRTTNVRPFANANDGKGMTAHGHLGDRVLPVRLPRAVGDVQTPQLMDAHSSSVESAPIPLVQLASALRKHLDTDYSKDTYAWLKAQFPVDLAPASTLDRLGEFADAWRGVLHPSEQQATGTNDVRASNIRRIK